MQWDFENIKNRNVTEKISNITDTIEGNYEVATGVSGKGLRLDGFTTRVIREGSAVKKTGNEFFFDSTDPTAEVKIQKASKKPQRLLHPKT